MLDRIPYQYNPLAQRGRIRVLDLQPARFHRAGVYITLREISLHDVLSGREYYEALSYVWGNHGRIKKISCSDRTLLVTPNCLQALRYLRNKNTARTLWIDAICINQDNLEEKAYQVAIMGEVYRLAVTVLIWYGEGNWQLKIRQDYDRFWVAFLKHIPIHYRKRLANILGQPGVNLFG
jgi:Heterokaryon incompatibility protein (HET)